MLMAMDIGNTNIKTALFRERELIKSWRVSTNLKYTSDEYGILMHEMFMQAGLSIRDVKGILISSVVPAINFTIEHMISDYFHLMPHFVGPGMKTGINILYENPKELGSDRICNAVASYYQFGSPCIFIDFGTATTFGCIGGNGNFLGGCILTGVRLAREAIVSGTSKLPYFELNMPEKVIGRSTITNLQSGILHGYVGQVNYLVSRMREEMDAPDAAVVATGGFATQIARESDAIAHIDSLLTLKGIQLIYEKNFGLI